MLSSPVDNLPAHLQPTATTSTPRKKNPRRSSHFAPVIQTTEQTKKFMAQELEGQWVGPMPPEIFLDKFLPLNPEISNQPLHPKTYFSGVFQNFTLEKDMYPLLIQRIKEAGVFPGFQLIDTSNQPDPASYDGKKTRPGISWYKENAELGDDKMQWDLLQGVFELKPWNRKSDPFWEGPAKEPCFSESTTNDGKECQGQLVGYGTQMCARQHRTQAFVIWIGDPFVRFIRFDRSGEVVSKKFNIETEGNFLLDFLWRFAHLSPARCGMDPTVRPATEAEVQLAHEHLSRWKPVKERPVVVMQVPDGKDSTREVIARGSKAEPDSLIGRATRGYPVWDTVLKKVVFLKDSWRALGPDVEQESTVLQILDAQNVKNVPTFVCGDDIPGQVTVTQQYALTDWNLGARSEELFKRAHNRFCEDFVGHSLDRFTSSKQFIQVVFDAFIAHQEAFEKCGILHRDISGGNIMITDEGRGILNDWDLARTVSEMQSGPRQKHRSGTWQFMSFPVLDKSDKLHEVPDDIESFVYVVLYFILRYMSHTQLKNLNRIIEGVFEAWEANDDGTIVGGGGKQRLANSRAYIKWDFEVTGNQPLTNWLDFALDAVHTWHAYYTAPSKRITGWKRTQVQEPALDAVIIRNHDEMVKAFKACLESENFIWPTDDAASDNLLSSTKRKLPERPQSSLPNKKPKTGFTQSMNTPVLRADINLTPLVSLPPTKATRSSARLMVIRARGSLRSVAGPSRLR